MHLLRPLTPLPVTTSLLHIRTCLPFVGIAAYAITRAIV
jgi:hypothetical protein